MDLSFLELAIQVTIILKLTVEVYDIGSVQSNLHMLLMIFYLIFKTDCHKLKHVLERIRYHST